MNGDAKKVLYFFLGTLLLVGLTTMWDLMSGTTAGTNETNTTTTMSKELVARHNNETLRRDLCISICGADPWNSSDGPGPSS